MNRPITNMSLGLLALIPSLAMPVLAQFPQGTLISIDEKGISNEYDFKDKLKRGEIEVGYQQVGSYKIDGGGKVLIVSGGGLMQNFDYSQGKITVTERIVIGELVIPRQIIYEDGIPTMSAASKTHAVSPGLYVDLGHLWLTMRQTKTIPELSAQLRSDDSKRRSEAVTALAGLGQPAGTALITALKDPDPDLRESAAIALGKLREARAVRALSALLHDKAWFVRLKVAWALGQMKGSEPIVALTEALKTEKNDFVRTAITKALKK